jgi:hypothetical protein
MGSSMASISRRQLLATAIFSFGLSEAVAQEEVDRTAIDAWMKAWMPADRQATGVLHLSRFADPMYFLLKPINWNPNPGQEAYRAVTVPEGFVTDFASIPRIFWSALRPDGLYTYPAIVHDYLYWEQNVSRDAADAILKYGMEDFRINTATVAAVYNAVRTFGNSAWQNNARLKAAGERRLLSRQPTDPTIRWEQWKRDANNFR